jgi:signal transduction histidine kinase
LSGSATIGHVGDAELARQVEPDGVEPDADVMLLLLDELEKRNVTLEQANRDLQHFASVAAHDLRSPLTIVRGYLEQALRHDTSMAPQTREWLDLALGATKRVSDLIHALLAHSTSTGADLVVTEVDLGRLFDEARMQLIHAGRGTDARIEIEPLPLVRGDHDLLSLVAQNLLENAVKFRRDDVAPIVEVTAQVVASPSSDLARDVCVVRVRDNGVGIAPEDRERVFALFGRAAHTGREGHGIGLATCARIIQRHRGSLRIVDVEGPGTAIEIELPCA